MGYFILRNGQQYGPYSQADVQRYLRTGDIFPGDLSRTDEMKEWLPVSRVLGCVAPPFPSPVAEFTAADRIPPVSSMQFPPHSLAFVPPPPGMLWGVLLLLVLVTLGCFGWLWSFVIARWVSKIDARNPATLHLACGLIFNIGAMGLLYVNHDLTAWALVLTLVALTLFVFAVFEMRKSIGAYYSSRGETISLSAVLTFFFHVLYFQFKFNRMQDASSVSRLVPAPR